MRTMLRSSRLAVSVAVVIAAIAIILGISNLPQKAQEKWRTGALPEQFTGADEITQDIRDGSKAFFRVMVTNKADRAAAAEYGRIVADYGSFVIVAADKGTSLEGSRLDGQPLETTVHLSNGSFDPILQPQAGAVKPGIETKFDGGGYYIVQFGMTASGELLESLEAAGVDVLQYVPHQAFFVYGSEESIAKVAGHSRVRWVGQFLPEYKVSPVLSDQLSAARSDGSPGKGISPIEKTGPNTAVFDIAVFERAGLNLVADRIASSYGGKVLHTIDLPTNYFNVIRVELPLDQVEAIANIPDVIAIDSWSRPQAEDEVAAQIVAGNYTGPTTVNAPGYNPLTQFGVNGTNVTVAVVDDGVGIPGDGGFYITASNTVNGPLRGATVGASGHGHLNATIIAGDAPFSTLDPNGYNFGLGVSPKSHIVNIPFLRTGYTGVEADTANDTVTTAGPNGVNGYISNNSWGAGTNGNTYDSFAALFDGFVRDASTAASIDPIVLVFSAGNSGGSGLTRPKVAKNLIATAATENVRPTLPSAGGTTGVADNLEQLPDFSSRGPAADTRVKPDISAPGDAVTGGRSGTDVLFGDIDTFHRISSGTSHAAPQIAGAAALFTQFWKANNAGVNPSPAMVKAALINGAVEVTGTGATAARPNGSEGWGRVNLKNVLNTGSAFTYFDQNATLPAPGTARLYAGSVADNTKPLRVTLVWTDPPGVADPSLVNNLDLEVTAGGNTFKGNVFSSGISTTGGLADNRNNVENVFLPAGTSGPISIRVIATALNGDGALGNADTTDQHFALVVFNSNVVPDASASLSAGTFAVTTGNNIIEPNECNSMNIALTNGGDTAATVVSAVLSTTTPGVSIFAGNSAYPNIAAGGGTQTNSTPFQVSTDNTVACGTNVNLKLTVTFTGGTSPVEFNQTLLVGQPANPNYTFSSTSGSIPAGGVLVDPLSQDDDFVLPIPLPAGWTSTVYGTPVTSLNASTNGFVSVNGVPPTGVTNAVLPATTGFPATPTLFAYWDDLDMDAADAPGGGIFTNTIGSAPNRTFVIEWKAEGFGDATSVINTNFAIVLTEGSDAIRYIYTQTGGAGTHLNGVSATVGVQAANSGTQFTQFSFNAANITPGLQLDGARSAGLCNPGAGTCGGPITMADVSGRVVTSGGRGINHATVTISNGAFVRIAPTSTFGYFRFFGVPTGVTYNVSVNAKRYTFTPQSVPVNANVTGLVFTASP